MNEGDVLEIVRSGMYTALIVAGPALAGALLTGVAISILQALTQVQEATLVYAPKIVAIFISLLIFMPLMGALLTGFMRHIAERIAAL